MKVNNGAMHEITDRENTRDLHLSFTCIFTLLSFI